MEVVEALKNRRTIRKFEQKKIDREIIKEIIDCTRYCANARNAQPLKYAIIDDDKSLAQIFPNTSWAGYLQDGAPKENERPVSYIAILGDKEISKSFEVDAGAAICAMMTYAYSKGIASCWLGALKRSEIMDILELSKDRYDLLYLLALGYPAQKSRTVKIEDNCIKYYEDENGTINVPKRELSEIIVKM